MNPVASIYREIAELRRDLQNERENSGVSQRIQNLARYIFEHREEIHTSFSDFDHIRSFVYSLQRFEELQPAAKEAKDAIDAVTSEILSLNERVGMNKPEKEAWLKNTPHFFDRDLINTKVWKYTPAQTFYIRPSSNVSGLFVLVWKTQSFTTKQIRIQAIAGQWIIPANSPRSFETLEDLIKDVVGNSAKSLGEKSITESLKQLSTPLTHELELGEKFKNKALPTFQKFRKIWSELGYSKNCPIHFDPIAQTIRFEIAKRDLIALGDKYPAFTSIVGSSNPYLYRDQLGEFGEYARNLSSNILPLETLSLEREGAVLLAADLFFRSLSKQEVSIEPQEETSDQALLKSLLFTNDFPGLFVGESHMHSAPKRFLIENMQLLKEQDVTTLFLEFLQYDSLQKSIDAYFEADSHRMPLDLEAALEHLDMGFHLRNKPYSYTTLVEAAKEAGIRIVGLEIEATRNMNQEGHERMKGLNYIAKEIIDREKGSGKFVALTGSGHVAEFDGVPGLSEICGCPNIVFDNPEDGQNETLFNVKNYSDEIETITGEIHVLKSERD